MELIDKMILNWCGSYLDDVMAGLHQVPHMMELSFAAYEWNGARDLIVTRLHILDKLTVGHSNRKALPISRRRLN